MKWDAARYDGQFGFVTSYGDDVLELLTLEPPASVLDVGCGTGTHAAALTARGYTVTGVDADPQMLERARALHPEVKFVAGDAQNLRIEDRFDAAFSNAALHWMTDQGAALHSIRRCLGDGAPFVAEMGGKNNVAVVDAALEAACQGFDVPPIRKFFPSVAQEATLLEAAGFDVEYMLWFPRPTRLSEGQTPADWTRLFRAAVWDAVPESQREMVAERVDEACGDLRDSKGWFIDYWRLRFVARAV